MEQSPKDLRKAIGDIYRLPKGGPVAVRVPALTYALVEGAGSPDQDAYRQAVSAVVGVSAAIRDLPKKGFRSENYDFIGPPLEGLYDITEGVDLFDPGNRDRWLWGLMILQPTHVNDEVLEEAKQMMYVKSSNKWMRNRVYDVDNPYLERVRIVTREPEDCVQVLHDGAFYDIPATLQRLDAFLREQGLVLLRKPVHSITIGSGFSRKTGAMLRLPVTERQ